MRASKTGITSNQVKQPKRVTSKTGKTRQKVPTSKTGKICNLVKPFKYMKLVKQVIVQRGKTYIYVKEYNKQTSKSGSR